MTRRNTPAANTGEYADLAEALLDIVRVSGAEVDAVCPFHDDSSPSLRFNTDSGLWLCHGCHESGNADSLSYRMTGKGTARMGLPSMINKVESMVENYERHRVRAVQLAKVSGYRSSTTEDGEKGLSPADLQISRARPITIIPSSEEGWATSGQSRITSGINSNTTRWYDVDPDVVPQLPGDKSPLSNREDVGVDVDEKFSLYQLPHENKKEKEVKYARARERTGTRTDAGAGARVSAREGTSARNQEGSVLPRKRDQELKIPSRSVSRTTTRARELLTGGKSGFDYTVNFGVTTFPASVAKLELGSEPELLRYKNHSDWWMNTRNFSEQWISTFGLGYEIRTNTHSIPIRDTDGQLLGLNIRNGNPDAEQKYKLPFRFARKEHLFGSWMVGKIPEFDCHTVVLCEGALDAIACWHVGYQGLATYGSSISENQVRLLHRLGVTTIVMGYDWDLAGYQGIYGVDKKSPAGRITHLDGARDKLSKFMTYAMTYPKIRGYVSNPTRPPNGRAKLDPGKLLEINPALLLGGLKNAEFI